MTAQEFTDRFDYDPDNDLLGEGGFGKIFKAWDNVRNEFIALKMSKVQLGMEEFSLLSEYERVKKLEHPNIARYMDCQRIKLPGLGTYDIALMKYYEHGNLGQVLKKHTLTAPQKQKIIDGLLDGIGYLHRQKPLIIHSDLKPSNILIVERNSFYIPLITDFGISRQAKVDDKSYVTNTVGAGTYAYAAPEQWEAKELRPNADLWSFGILVIYTWFNGKKLPFRSDDISVATESGRIEYMKRVIALDFIPDLKELPDYYKKMIDACLVVSPQARMRSVDELLKKLNPPKAETKEEDTAVLLITKPQKQRIPVMDEKTQIFIEEKPKPAPLPEEQKKEDIPLPVIEKKSNKAVLIAATVLFAAMAGGSAIYFLQPKAGTLKPVVKQESTLTKPDTITQKMPDAKPKVSEVSLPMEKIAAGKPEFRKEKSEKINTSSKLPKEDRQIYHVVDEGPSFPGGKNALKTWIASNLRMPQEADRSFITGKVRVSFIINANGSREDISVIEGLGYGCDEEAIRLVRSMPLWTPGRNNEKNVRVKHTLDIPFE